MVSTLFFGITTCEKSWAWRLGTRLTFPDVLATLRFFYNVCVNRYTYTTFATIANSVGSQVSIGIIIATDNNEQPKHKSFIHLSECLH